MNLPHNPANKSNYSPLFPRRGGLGGERLFFLFIISLLLTSCSPSDIAPYSGTDGIYFNNRTSGQVLTDSTEQTFIYIEDETIDVPVVIQVMGDAATYDRPVALTISGDATEGTDYVLPVEPIVRAGEYKIDYIVRLLKTAALSDTTKVIRLRLAENEYFQTRFTHEGDSASASNPEVSALSYTIRFSNQFTKAPDGWNTDFAGPFSVRKLDLLVKLFPDVARADYNVIGKISLAKWSYMQVEANQYIFQQETLRAMGSAYDEMAFDEEGNILVF